MTEPAPESDAQRERLVEAAVEILVSDGPSGLTTRRVARAAGVAHGLLYTRFKDKDELLLAALSARARALVVEFDAQVPEAGEGTVAQNLLGLARALVTVQEGLTALVVGLAGRRSLLERFVQELHAPPIGGPDRILRTTHAYLEGERELARVDRGADVHVVGVLLFALAQLQALVGALGGKADAARPALEPFTSFLAAALRPH